MKGLGERNTSAAVKLGGTAVQFGLINFEKHNLTVMEMSI